MHQQDRLVYQAFVHDLNYYRIRICLEAPPGFEPGMADLQSASQTPQGEAVTPVTASPSFSLAHSLARETQTDPDLARLVDAWATLPPTVKRMILAALGASGPVM